MKGTTRKKKSVPPININQKRLLPYKENDSKKSRPQSKGSLADCNQESSFDSPTFELSVQKVNSKSVNSQAPKSQASQQSQKDKQPKPKPKSDRRKVKLNKEVQDQMESIQNKPLSKEQLEQIYTKLLDVFSARGTAGHVVIGRKKESQIISKFISQNLDEEKNGLLYICGHPGQGKTALVNQILNQEYNQSLINQQSNSNNTTCNQTDRLFVLSYNAMSFAGDNKKQGNPEIRFLKQLLSDLDTIYKSQQQQSKITLKKPKKKAKSVAHITPVTQEQQQEEEVKEQQILDRVQLTQQIQSRLIALNHFRPHLLIVIDEIDALKTQTQSNTFVDTLQSLLKPQQKSKNFKQQQFQQNCSFYSLSIIGIANSIDLFQNPNEAEIVICSQNELKLLFKPYTHTELAQVLQGLALEVVSPTTQIFNEKSFQMAASKIDKISGDIRMCFEVMRETIQRKLDSKQLSTPISVFDVNEVLVMLFESKIAKLVKKLPRSHVIMLDTIIDWIDETKNVFVTMDSGTLLTKYNYRARELMIEKVNLGEVNDILYTLEQSDILVYAEDNKKNNSKNHKSATPNGKSSSNRLSILVSGKKQMSVQLKCDLKELKGALQQDQELKEFD